MNTDAPVLECIPNFSHGSQDEGLRKIISSIDNIEGQKLLNVDSNLSANRSVITFAGKPEYVVEAALQAIATAAEVIDMRHQHGVHPRIGATDVCPLVPLHNCSMKEAVYWADILAKRVGKLLNIPVYLYEYSARRSYRLSLPQIRKGGYEQLLHKMSSEKWQPDYGPAFNARNKDSILRTGATVIGARDILVALNISLSTTSKKIASGIAGRLRSSGLPAAPKAGNPSKQSPGLFPALRAIGWFIEDFHTVQVSFNFLDYKITSPLRVWEATKKLALESGCEATGCEVIGLIPKQCILEAGIRHAEKKGLDITGQTEKQLILWGIAYLGLDRIKPFDPEEKILEYALEHAGLI